MTVPQVAHGVLCHYFAADAASRVQGALTADEFAVLLDVYGPRLVNADEWIGRAIKGTQKDECCVTFDDGLREAWLIALPVLNKRGLTAAWNIYTAPYVGVPLQLEQVRWLRNHVYASLDAFYDAVDCPDAPADYLADRGYLTRRDRAFRYWRAAPLYAHRLDTLLAQHDGFPLIQDHWIRPDELRALSMAGHVIGLHTHSHPLDMTMLSREQQVLEYATSRALLEQMLRGAAVMTGSHPRGTVTHDGLTWLQRSGMRLMWGATMQGSPPWHAPRWSTGYWRL